jgi:hypothetical protein
MVFAVVLSIVTDADTVVPAGALITLATRPHWYENWILDSVMFT